MQNWNSVEVSLMWVVFERVATFEMDTKRLNGKERMIIVLQYKRISELTYTVLSS